MILESKLKYKKLLEILSSYKSLAIAFSGGVDSTFLLFAAKQALGKNILAITVKTQSYPTHEELDAQKILQELQVEHLNVDVDQLSIEGFKENDLNRCYYCKKALFSAILEQCTARGFNYVADGANIDDEKDYRPGMRATSELKIKSPLREAGLTKKEIRALSKNLGLFTWNKPSYACLASRIPYGENITTQKLRMIEICEQCLLDLGFSEMRVRLNEKMARIEVPVVDLGKFLQPQVRNEIITTFKKTGFEYITLDLEGFRSGNLNNGLKKNL